MSEQHGMPTGELDLATLREGFAALAGDPPAATAGPCPEPETIYRAVAGELPPRELRAVVEHSAACPQCAEAWRLAKAFEEEAATEVAEPRERSAAARSRSHLRLMPLAATLVVALLAAGVWFTVGQGPAPAPIVRGAGDGRGIVSLLPEGEPLDRAEPVLRWATAEGDAPMGTTYDVVVTADLRQVAEAGDLTEPTFRIPDEALSGLPSGTELQWQVEAVTPAGDRLRSVTILTPLG
jgi:hypothetical protein